jgi:poly-gamma-glutamate synthesis protein (capsule biosynthesis protein)
MEAAAGSEAQISTVRRALAGDTTLGRKVAEAIVGYGPESLFADEVIARAHAFHRPVRAQPRVLHLPTWQPLARPAQALFRAPPEATEVLDRLGVDCVTPANNHALDYGSEALLETFEYLQEAGIPWVGAGRNRDEARAPVIVEKNGLRLGVIGCSDHPLDFAAGPTSPGIAYVDLQQRLDWLPPAIAALDVEAVLVTPHWEPTMIPEPLPYIRRAAVALRQTPRTGHIRCRRLRAVAAEPCW